ncbi:MAG: hypothetical protein A3K19_11145 [Lentisphaerae bacterium RIFOXYB12_FULL_65_16]|nr:MAG: hypothetical protein A3K18_25695 [Lentisphaerae bacterium RIFOXYA12_64_32]OGV90789.1 MAG: hypothetical protein A3K19_11145 [Lentisphaerae bacterium RIFOXYB12_FULL_65_16]
MHRNRNLLLSFVVPMTAVALAAAAVGDEPVAPQPTAPPERVLRLGEMLVEASPLDRDLLQKPTLESESLEIATSTVESEDIRLQDAGTLSEAMDYSTGMFTERRGRKEKTLSSFRGQIYPYPDFALNGVWQRSFWEVPSFLPAAAIERVEILRSGGAIMVGPNSGLVGAVNVVPRRFDEPTTIFDVQAGTYETFRESVVHGDRFDRGYYTVGASRYSTGGPENANAAERYGSFFGTGGVDVTHGLHLELTGFYLTGARELRLIEPPGITSPPAKSLSNRYEQFDPSTSYGGITRALFQHDDDSSTEVDIGYVRRENNYERANSPANNAEEIDWEYNAGIIHAHNLTDDNTLRVGLQYNHWVCPDGKRDFVGKRMDVETGSVVVMDEHRFDRLTLDAGVRVTRSWYRDYTDNSFNITGANMGTHPIQDEWADPAITGTFGAKYQVTKPVALYSHVAVGTLDSPPGAVAEDGGSIDREQRLILDGGVGLEDPRLGSAKLGGFLTLRENAILLSETKYTESGQQYNTYANNDVRQYGLEFECRSVKFCNLFSLFATTTVMDSERYTDGNWETYKEIPNVIATGGVYSAYGPVDVNLYGKYVSGFENKRFAQDGKYHDLGDFVDLNMTAGVSFGKEKATRVYCSLKNMLDDEYSTVVGYPEYGFQAFIGLQHRM